MSASLVVTARKTEGQWTESALEHWERFVERALPALIRHALVHWGMRYVGWQAAEPAELSKYEVFLSFASANRSEAEEIKKAAEEEGVRLFFSTTDLETGSRFSDQIREALTLSAEVWVLATRAALESVWVQTEWGGAWALNKPIVPILLRISQDQLPDRLQALQAIDFHRFRQALKRVAREKSSAASSRG